jgi:hypothetical protein
VAQFEQIAQQDQAFDAAQRGQQRRAFALAAQQVRAAAGAEMEI